ncbi:hypothetical protein PC129_g17085 [Phytophthora cactorum]|uniref:Uncharacterized protein n=1 Tax=Phytophthora cactorum TaxID=29920 RepID=A0A8T1K6C5_9STRA|nr:hypothetical protein Pcac1_g13748 [Phytophthora cactorum]KAG2795681.1 hypothetical protein PC112_g22530 [Phytophthora cactorum]KAG2844242.1 hypothetical protein PC113_g18431 [Phytophthora cactorum]KAG2883079.1 hypothetical protein PC115_g21739 [Phytophthora cactorum]KAG2884534.1 hypothetical protein PC114_g20055 [Phytophthora cactorum]
MSTSNKIDAVMDCSKKPVLRLGRLAQTASSA